MNPTTTIVFTDIKFKELGTVEFDGEKLIPSNDYAKAYVDAANSAQMTPAEWVKKFSSWSNGYVTAEVVPMDQSS